MLLLNSSRLQGRLGGHNGVACQSSGDQLFTDSAILKLIQPTDGSAVVDLDYIRVLIRSRWVGAIGLRERLNQDHC